jgi:tetratricopeptide (TPR) repeat protein
MAQIRQRTVHAGPSNIQACSGPVSKSQLESQAHIFYNDGKYLQSLFLAKKALQLRPNDPRLLTNIGSTLEEMSNLTGTLFYYKKALTYDHHHIGALIGIGDILEKLGDKNKNNSTAMMYFKEALKQPITDDSNKSYSDVKFVQVEELERAGAFIELRNYSQAIEIANQILKEDSQQPDALGVKGVALIYLGKNSEALNIFNTLISQGHVAPSVLDNRGVALLGLKNYVEAISNFNDTLKADPGDEYAYFNRAIALLNLDLYSQHIYPLQQLLQHKQVTFKHLDPALQDLNKGLTINPYDKDAANLKNLLIDGLKLGYIRR